MVLGDYFEHWTAAILGLFICSSLQYFRSQNMFSWMSQCLILQSLIRWLKFGNSNKKGSLKNCPLLESVESAHHNNAHKENISLFQMGWILNSFLGETIS